MEMLCNFTMPGHWGVVTAEHTQLLQLLMCSNVWFSVTLFLLIMLCGRSRHGGPSSFFFLRPL